MRPAFLYGLEMAVNMDRIENKHIMEPPGFEVSGVKEAYVRREKPALATGGRPESSNQAVSQLFAP